MDRRMVLGSYPGVIADYMGDVLDASIHFHRLGIFGLEIT
jgi:hypothetical protein